MVNTGFNMNLPWHRVFMFVNYTWANMRNESDGPFGLPANNFDPRAEWGPSMMDISPSRQRHDEHGSVEGLQARDAA